MSKNKVIKHRESENTHVKKARSPQSIEQHPILQLQQTIGNKAVTNMIQRHPEQAAKLSQMWSDHWNTGQSVIYAHDRIKKNEALVAQNKSGVGKNRGSIGVLFGKVNQLSQSSGGGSESADIYED
jgi:hypothetical protein